MKRLAEIQFKVMGFQIGEHSAIFMDAWFDTNGSFALGSHSVVNQKYRLDNRGRIRIGTNVSISAEVTILTADHDPRSPTFEGRCKPVTIEDFVFVGTRAMILPGVTLSRGCVVAAGSVVTHNVAPFQIVAGVPATPLGQRPEELNYTIDYMRPLF